MHSTIILYLTTESTDIWAELPGLAKSYEDFIYSKGFNNVLLRYVTSAAEEASV